MTRSVGHGLRGQAVLPPAFATVMGGLVLLAVTAAGSIAAARASVTLVHVQPSQELAVLLRSQEALSGPVRHSPPVRLVQARRPMTDEQTVLPVIGHETDAAGVSWLRVMLPGRPNGRTGWIRQRTTAQAVTAWHIVVYTSRPRVVVYRSGRPVRVFRAIVGKRSTPTPQGEFFVEETVLLRPGEAGAPFALALSARSDVLQEFEGGPGQIALHGVANIGGVLGTAVSHGCVRLSTAAISWLGKRIGTGVPVTIAP
jgi:lipoprotein-anchoring transpeptidase ErfK/SrfK